jgi:hypothetical protein
MVMMIRRRGDLNVFARKAKKIEGFGGKGSAMKSGRILRRVAKVKTCNGSLDKVYSAEIK